MKPTLASEAYRIAEDGAFALLTHEGHTGENAITQQDYNVLLETIQRALDNGGLESALRDAKEAFDAGMPQYASLTFAASMRLIGMTAARSLIDSFETAIPDVW